MIFEFIKKCNFNENSIILEIGSHMGFDTEKIYNFTQKSKIFCFEPDPRNLKILFERNIDKISSIIDCAISNVDSNNVDFNLSTGIIPQKTGNHYYDDNLWTASSSLRKPKLHNDIFPWCKIQDTVQIKSMTLDTFAKNQNIKNINFIWMDVQGCEDLVFEGGQEILKNTEYIYTEYSNIELYEGQKKLEDIVKILPGKWSIHNFDEANVLLKNEDYRSKYISNTGFWILNDVTEHVFDLPLANEILNFFHENNISTCLDLGCGYGEYTKLFNLNNISTKGYDGNPHTPLLTNGSCEVLDLSKKISLNKTQCVMSLEVGEHIPKKYENIFINNLINHASDFIILSWALPGQGGYGHVNCQTNKYIKDKIKKFGWENLSEEENKLRNSAENSWFKETIMVFKKKKND